MKKILIILIAIGFILSCKLLDKGDEQSTNIVITLDYSKLNDKSILEKTITDYITTASIDEAKSVIFYIDYSYSNITNNVVDIDAISNSENWSDYCVTQIQSQLNNISDNNCTIHSQPELTIDGSKAKGEFILESGVYNILVGLFENSDLKYVGATNIFKLNAGESESVTISVDPINTVPEASFSVSPESGTTETTFTFDASGSIDNEDITSLLQVRWDWENDGIYDTDYSTTKIATHEYNTENTYTVKIEVKDTGDLTDNTTKSITVTEECTTPIQVSLNTPSNGSADISTIPTLIWNNISNADSYRIQVDDNSDLSSTFIDQGGINSNSKGISGLDYSTTYYWRVSATNTCGTGLWSSAWSFTTEAEPVSPPSAATSPTPSNGASSQDSNVDLSWSNGGGATTYDVYFGRDATPDSGENKGNQSETSYNLGGLSYSTTYYWRIDAVNSAGTTTGTVWSFTTEAEPVSPPSAATSPTPSNGASSQDSNVDLGWSNGGGATSYDVYFGTDSSPDSGENKGNQSGTSYNPGTLSYSTTYYWRIDAVNSAGTTTGTVWSFTTEAEPVSPPSAATSPTPSNGASSQDSNVDLGWSNGGGATSYDVYFGTDSSPDSGENKGNQSGTSYNPGTLSYSTTYYWRIDAVNSAGTTTGTVWSFTTEAEPVSPPSAATSPTPSNGASSQDSNVDLGWSNGGGATSYDVYFGTDSSPDSGENKGNQSGTSYNPDTLSYSTTYYWRIDAVNSAGTTTGTVWSFTTEAEPVSPPSAATSPTPSNGASSQDSNVDLGWSNGGGATSYDVYFGTDSSPDSGENKGNQSGTSYNPGTLSYSTTYYWRIDAVNSAGTTTGTVWSFTTLEGTQTYGIGYASWFSQVDLDGDGYTRSRVLELDADVSYGSSEVYIVVYARYYDIGGFGYIKASNNFTINNGDWDPIYITFDGYEHYTYDFYLELFVVGQSGAVANKGHGDTAALNNENFENDWED